MIPQSPTQRKQNVTQISPKGKEDVRRETRDEPRR